MGFGVLGIQPNRMRKLLQGSLGVPEHGPAEARAISHIREVGMIREDPTEIEQRCRVVVPLERRLGA